MDLALLAESLEARAIQAVKMSLNCGNAKEALIAAQTAGEMLDLAERLGAAGAYPKAYVPLKQFQDFK